MNKRFIGLVLLQIALLLSVAARYHWVDWTGQPVTLKTAPIDPRDLFYGDYVILNYEISRIDLDEVEHDVEPGDEPEQVYVLLERRKSGWHEMVGVFRSKPEPGPGQAVLKGTARRMWDGKLSIKYGIERYYVTENTGKKWEDARDELQFVDLKVSSGGDAVIKELRVGE